MSVTAAMPQATKPPITLGGVIRQSGRSLYRTVLGRSLSQSGAEKAIQLKMGPIALAVIAATALLYHQGAQSVKPDGGDKTFWKKALLESGLGYLIIDNTKGVFPLWGIGLGAYRAGQKNNLLEKAQALVGTAITMAMGYIGIHLGASFTEVAYEMEEREMARVLNDEPFQKWVQSLQQHNQDDVKALGTVLQDLKAKLTQQDEWFRKGAQQDWKALRPLRSEIEALKSAAYEHLSQLDEALIKPGSPEARKLLGAFGDVLTNSQEAYIKLVRSLNPLFGYLIFGLLVGTPLVRLANKLLEARFPEWKKKTFGELFNKSTALPDLPAAHHAPAVPTLYMPGIGNGTLH